MSERQNCPFCGKNAAAVDTIDCGGARPAKFRIQCQECKAATAWHDREHEAWAAWNMRDTKGISHVINKDAFILNNLLYARNHSTGNCTAQKERGGKSLRIKEDVFLEAYEECRIEVYRREK